MMTLKDLVESNGEPYGLFHATQTPVDELARVGLAPSDSAPPVLYTLVHQLREGLQEHLDAPFDRPLGAVNGYYPLEMGLSEQLARARLNNKGVVLTLEEGDAITLLGSMSEPERSARALLSFAMDNAPGLLGRLQEGDAGGDIRAALELLDATPRQPVVFLQVVKYPPDGYFSLLARPDEPITGLHRLPRSTDARPVARAILFNGVIPYSCLRVIPGPLAKMRRTNRVP